MTKSIFRENALKQLTISHEIHDALIVIDPFHWRWIFIVFIILFAFFIWIFFGTLSFTVQTDGIVRPACEMEQIDKIIQADKKEKDEHLRVLQQILSQKRMLFRRHYLTAYELEKSEAELLSQKASIANPNEMISISPTSCKNNALTVLLFIHQSQGHLLSPNMPVRLFKINGSTHDHDAITGKIMAISNAPLSKKMAYAYLQNMNLVDDYFSHGAPFLATVSLDYMINAINPGALLNAEILYQACSPFTYFMLPTHCR